MSNKLSFFYLQLFICRLLCVIKHLIYEFIHIYLSKRYLFSFINHQKETRNRLSCTYLVFKSFCYKYFVSTAQIHIFFHIFLCFSKKVVTFANRKILLYKNYMKRKLTLLLTCLLAGISLAIAQTSRKVMGVVFSEEDNQPVIGASVLVKGTSIGTTTDLDGKFVINNGTKFIKNLVTPLPLSSIFHLFSSPFLPFHQSPGTVFYRHETEYLYEYDDYHQLYSLHPQNLLEKASESSTTPPEY